jgi:hypothetical protein
MTALDHIRIRYRILKIHALMWALRRRASSRKVLMNCIACFEQENDND